MREKPNVVIVGVGLIGGSLGMALKRSGRAGCITGVSRPDTLAKAEALGCIDRGFPYDALAEALGDADVLFLACPIQRIISLVAALADMTLPAGLIISDVGSTKGRITETAQALLPDHVHFIGGHPMAGSETSGVQGADPFLFQNAIYVLCPADAVPDALCREFGDFLGVTGARIIIMDAVRHDHAVAKVSHLPQLLAVSLVNFLTQGQPDGQTDLQLAAGGFRDMTRIASSPFGMWRDIIETNEPVLKDALKHFAGQLSHLSDSLEPASLEKAFDLAAHARSGIPKDSKGFLHPLSEILVVLEDRPGMILGIAAPLAEADINIQDIEVLKVREGEAGTLRLAFSDHSVSRQAMAILKKAGFSVRPR